MEVGLVKLEFDSNHKCISSYCFRNTFNDVNNSVKSNGVENLLDAFTKRRIEKVMDEFTQKKAPPHIRNQIKFIYRIRGNNVTLIEERPAFKSDRWVQLDIAQFRLDEGKWKIYWKDSKGKWHFVDDYAPDEDFEKQLRIVDQDTRGIFWG